MTATNAAKPTHGFVTILAGDVLALTALALVVMRGVIRLYPTGMIVCLLIFAANVLLARAATRRRAKERMGSVPWYLWFVAAVFTLAGIIAIALFFREPSVPHGTQAGVAVLLLSYIWYLIRRKRRGWPGGGAGSVDG